MNNKYFNFFLIFFYFEMSSEVIQTSTSRKNWRSLSFSSMTKTSYSNNCKNRLLIKKLLLDEKRAESLKINNNSFFRKFDSSSIKKFKNTNELNEIFLTKFASSSNNYNIKKGSRVSKNESKFLKEVKTENLKTNIEEINQMENKLMSISISKKSIILNSMSLSKRASNCTSAKSSPHIKRGLKPVRLVGNQTMKIDTLQNEENLRDSKLMQENCSKKKKIYFFFIKNKSISYTKK